MFQLYATLLLLQDHWASRVPSARVVGAPDSGYFFTKGANYPAWQTQLLWVVNAMNSSAGLNQACVAAEGAAGRDPMMCAFPEVCSSVNIYLCTMDVSDALS